MSRRRPRSIHLDTSFLIRALDPASTESEVLQGWLTDRRFIALSALAWGEFLCGPLEQADVAVASRIAHRFVPVGVDEATEAARLFNGTGRRRGSFADCLIAASAILADAELATSNRTDFERFADEGLQVVDDGFRSPDPAR